MSTYEYQREWRKQNPDKFRAYNKKYRLSSRDSINARKRRRYHRDAKLRDYARAYARKIKGLPDPTRACPDVCEICGQKPRDRSLALDHDHNTGLFCGWLCVPCNRALGGFREDKNLLQAALNYLTVTNKTSRLK